MRKVMVLLLLALLAVLAGCYTPGATGAYSNVYGGHSLQSVEKSILTALYELEWSAKKVNSQTIEATLYVKKPLLSKYSEHILTVLINYSPQAYSIRYKNSVNLDYDIETNTIDSRYDVWLDELNQRIQDELTRTQNQMLAPTMIYVDEAPLEEVIIVETVPVVVLQTEPERTTVADRVIVVEPTEPEQIDVLLKTPAQSN